MIDDAPATRRLERLDPPAGGELRLRRALAAVSRAPRWPLPAAAALASVWILVAIVYRPDPQRERIRQALQLAMSPQPEIQVESGHVTTILSANPRVRIYKVVGGKPPKSKPTNERPGGSGAS